MKPLNGRWTDDGCHSSRHKDFAWLFLFSLLSFISISLLFERDDPHRHKVLSVISSSSSFIYRKWSFLLVRFST
jgi:hypothetical protein